MILGHCVAISEKCIILAVMSESLISMVPIRQVLLRKGGIEEKGFKVEARRFLLFPSFFHADASLLKPGMTDRYKEVWI